MIMIFISYRREDTAYPAGWLFDRLIDHLGRGAVFKDVHSIGPGDDFIAALARALESCAVLLAVIGRRWLSVTDEQGRWRLNESDDFVRLEIETALRRGIRVIPVLVDGAQMPKAGELPASLTALASRQAIELSPSRFTSDLDHLLTSLTAVVDAVPSAAPANANKSVVHNEIAGNIQGGYVVQAGDVHGPISFGSD